MSYRRESCHGILDRALEFIRNDRLFTLCRSKRRRAMTKASTYYHGVKSSTNSFTMSHSGASAWSLWAALTPCLAISGAFAFSLYILSSPSHYRLSNIALVFVLTAGFERSFGDLYPDDVMNTVFAHGVLIWLVHMVHVTLVQGDASYIAGRSTQSEDVGWSPASAPTLSPYHRAYKMLWNYRGIGTLWQVVKTSQPPLRDEKARRQLRRRFLLRRLLTIFCRYVALAVLYEVSESHASLDKSIPPVEYNYQLQPGHRTHLVIYFIFHNWLWIASFHECLSIIFIYVLRLDEPHEWPPIYGNLLKAYTVRGFWAYFWHRLVYAPFRAVADRLSARVFGKGSRGPVRRLANVAMVFLLSGVLHSIIAWEKSACNYWASGILYFVQPVGFVLEGMVQFAWAPLRSRIMMFRRGLRVLSAFERIVGYIWVWTWFFWLYPQRTMVELNCRAKGYSR